MVMEQRRRFVHLKIHSVSFFKSSFGFGNRRTHVERGPSFKTSYAGYRPVTENLFWKKILLLKHEPPVEESRRSF